MTNKTVSSANAETVLNQVNNAELAANAPVAHDGEQIVALGDLIEFVKGDVSVESTGEFPFVLPKNFSDSYLNCKVDYAALERVAVGSPRLYSDNCLLGLYMGGKFVVGRLTDMPEGAKFGFLMNVFPFKLKSDLVSEDFLLRSLFLPETVGQADALTIDEDIPLLSRKDFLAIQIAVPSKEEQDKRVMLDAEAKMSESEKQLKAAFDEFQKDVRMKRHAIGQTIQDMNGWMAALNKARSNGNGTINDSDVVGKAKQFTVAEICNNLRNCINKFTKQVERIGRGDDFEVKRFALTEFIEDYIAKNQNPLFSFEYDASKHHHESSMPELIWDDNDMPIGVKKDEFIFKEGDPKEYVTFAPEALKLVFDNIISNACAHGFDGRGKDNVIKIELDQVGAKHVITIANNGAPLHSQLSNEDVFTYGRSSKSGQNHSGLGGYEVGKLMKNFNGDAEFVNEPEAEFPVAYKLTFNDTGIYVINITSSEEED